MTDKTQGDSEEGATSQSTEMGERMDVIKSEQRAPTVSLVLGSGGARGLAHIGVIEFLQQQGFDIRAIAGSSMGALVGAMYAMGKLEVYRDWVSGLSQSDVFSLVDWTLSGGGIIRGQRIIGKLRELAGDANIEDMPLNYTAVTVDIDHGREVWLSDGPVYDAIRASIAIPGLFTPHRYRGRTLVDGGLINPVPVGPTLRTITDLTIVVNVNGPDTNSPAKPLPRMMSDEAERDEPRQSASRHSDGDDEGENGSNGGGVLAKIKDYIDSFSSESTPKANSPGLMAVLMRSLETMQTVIARQQLGVFAPDLIIDIPRNACMIHEFHRAAEMVELGRRCADCAWQEYQRQFEQQRELLRASNS